MVKVAVVLTLIQNSQSPLGDKRTNHVVSQMLAQLRFTQF